MLTLALILAAVPTHAMADEGRRMSEPRDSGASYVIYSQPTKVGGVVAIPGLAERIDFSKSSVSGSTVDLVTVTGRHIPVRYFRDDSAAELASSLANHMSINVAGCTRQGDLLSRTMDDNDPECSTYVYETEYVCGRLESAPVEYALIQGGEYELIEGAKGARIIGSRHECRRWQGHYF